MGLSARGRALPRRASRRARMRGVCARAAGPAHDFESSGRDEQPHLRCRRGDNNAADFVKANLLPYKYPREIKFIDELPKDRHRQDLPPGADEDVASLRFNKLTRRPR